MITQTERKNPVYSVFYSDDKAPIQAYSKIYDDIGNPTKDFAAIMTCAEADKNCPLIRGADRRILVTYEDPKEFDNRPEEASKYDERSIQIASEMFYVFSKIK